MAEELFRAYVPFGRLTSQFSHLGAALSLDSTEQIGLALSYHWAVNQNLQERARHHIPGPALYTELLAEQQFAPLGNDTSGNALATAPSPADDKVKEKGGKKGQKCDRPEAPRRSTRLESALVLHGAPHRSPRRRRSRPRQQPHRVPKSSGAAKFFVVN